jgi:hypothetical protein
MIDEALASPRPHSVVPTFDEDGHGTFLASVAAGNEKGDYIGAAPKADLMIVKLRRARPYYIERYLLSPDDPNLYESSDYLLGIKYILDRAEELNRPVVVCIGMGSNSPARTTAARSSRIISPSSRSGRATRSSPPRATRPTPSTTRRAGSRAAGTETVSVKVGEQGVSFSVVIFGPGVRQGLARRDLAYRARRFRGYAVPLGAGVLGKARAGGYDAVYLKYLQGREQQPDNRVSQRHGGNMGYKAVRGFDRERRVLGVAAGKRGR